MRTCPRVAPGNRESGILRTSRIRWGNSSLSLISLLQCPDIDLRHLKHCFHDSLRSLRIPVLQHPAQDSGNDLPGHTIPVLEPAALYLLSSLRELRNARQDVRAIVSSTSRARDRICRMIPRRRARPPSRPRRSSACARPESEGSRRTRPASLPHRPCRDMPP